MTVKVSSSMVHGELQWRTPPVAVTGSRGVFKTGALLVTATL
ncbi:hypothetical protein QFZ76_005610 [Streptomyces sp. V4I2]|nr:hypothetical protein [Streptomyces sp. V4I2]